MTGMPYGLAPDDPADPGPADQGLTVIAEVADGAPCLAYGRLCQHRA
jgi:hypothetical protein